MRIVLFVAQKSAFPHKVYLRQDNIPVFQRELQEAKIKEILQRSTHN